MLIVFQDFVEDQHGLIGYPQDPRVQDDPEAGVFETVI